MDYAYAVKALPQDDEIPQPDPGQPPTPSPPQHTDDGRPWAGDPYDEGDETDPAQANAAFAGEGGEEAWLDKATDGTLTGWVRDNTGQVWRYADPDAWAIDVDDAGMTQIHGSAGEAPAPEQGIDAAGQAPPDGTEQPEHAEPFSMEVAAADETPAAADGEDPEAAEDAEAEEEPEEPEDDEDEAAPAGGKKPKKKPWD